jgi:hypothetical protein
MEHISEPLRRNLEAMLDELVDFAASLPDGRQKIELNQRINQLEEELLSSGEA